MYYRLREAERGSHKAHTDRYHIILRCALCRASVMHLGHLALQLAEASRFMQAQSLSMIIVKVMRIQVQEGRKLSMARECDCDQSEERLIARTKSASEWR